MIALRDAKKHRRAIETVSDCPGQLSDYEEA